MICCGDASRITPISSRRALWLSWLGWLAKARSCHHVPVATDTRLALGAVAVVLAAAGLLVGSPSAALGTSCELTRSVDENLEEASQLHEVVDIGVFETEVVASSPALLWFKDPVRYEALVRSWGVAPDRWSGIKGQGGGVL